eukprot:Plantae.Rhodophyta-Rhodochaete_pulchella.ctg1446.p2 GENE.Plantae.Rhodophyta-Rhodochaete_pulchella.ctg1446~~Plantae.Rhodophyta-Rhodochaete_pulchella.ctg1446.p2  ORF type:complete len:212 (-),score=37.53 Plantae.Rhodophyta-Rhodochaete_pulchella.ctg1446:2973-3608(-)
MVFFYTTSDASFAVYAGRDKYENETLLKYAWDEDVWFHVEKLSSAHVYLRLNPGQTLDDIPDSVLTDCCQLVKHNSIEGNKQNNVPVIYTFRPNLRKTAHMDTGQVAIVDNSAVRRVVVEKRVNEVINRLNKTKIERNDVDWEGEKEAHERELVRRQREIAKSRLRTEKDVVENARKEKEARSYDRLFKEDCMVSNKSVVKDYTAYEDDFM